MIAGDTMIKTDSPAPSPQLIEQEKREQRDALDRIRRILCESARRRRSRPPDDERGGLCWARGIHRPPPAGHEESD